MQADLENFAKAAKTKGIQIVGTGDFTHPKWFQEIKEKLEPAEDGLFKLKKELGQNPTRFVLSAEISCIYTKSGKVRKIHLVILAPSIAAVEKINAKLSLIGNLKSDGRPILGLDAKELLKIVLDADEQCLVVPGHCMTPWFGIFGSKSGFDSLSECFDDYSKYIFALETGLSADPLMMWRIPDARLFTLISNSDAHSPAKLGREINVFEGEKADYNLLIQAIKSGAKMDASAKLRFIKTIEFFPQEGKYHFDGHRQCGVCLSPLESRRYNNVCPVCGKPLTLGVSNRIEQLADQKEGFVPEEVIPFKSLIPLQEIIAEALSCGRGTKKEKAEYDKLIQGLGNEFFILTEATQKDLEKTTLPQVAEAIIRAREGKVIIEPGYDGVFGKISIFSKKERKDFTKQRILF